MPQHTTSFEIADKNTIRLPHQLIASGGFYNVQVQNGDVYIAGNTNGLLYLAEVLIQCAKGAFVAGFHVHIPQDSKAGPPTDGRAQDEVVVFAASELAL